MIQREKKVVQVVSFSTSTDLYGQKRTQQTGTRDVEMVIKIHTQTNTDDVRFVDVDMIGLTLDKNITTTNQIVDGESHFNVLYVVPSGRYSQVFMKRV